MCCGPARPAVAASLQDRTRSCLGSATRSFWLPLFSMLASSLHHLDRERRSRAGGRGRRHRHLALPSPLPPHRPTSASATAQTGVRDGSLNDVRVTSRAWRRVMRVPKRHARGGGVMNGNKLGNSGCNGQLALAVGGETGLSARLEFEPRNRILAALPRQVLASLLPHLKPTFLPRNKVLCDINEPLRRVYFVETGLVSMVAVFENHATAEMATVGREGLVGISSVLGGEQPLGRYVVPIAGTALVVEATRFRTALRDSPELRAVCKAYAQAFLREALQTAACNSVHMVEERCARWLLMSHDRSDGDTLALTQAHLADILGVCRSTVTLAAGALQRAGFIRYRRGAIIVRDRAGLETAACECYRVIRNQYEQLLPRTCQRQPSLVDQPRLSHALGYTYSAPPSSEV